MELEINSSWYQRPTGVKERVSAGGIVVRIVAGRPLVALTREGNWPLFVLPKGGVEDGETLEQAARREIEEEAGLNELETVAYLGARERLNYARTRWMTVHYYLFLTRQSEGQPTDPKHPNQITWFTLEQLPPMLWPEQQALIVEFRERIQDLAGRLGEQGELNSNQ
jgi:ADP-ribose pyrophosphatase YjhB (NUDIX family)